MSAICIFNMRIYCHTHCHTLQGSVGRRTVIEGRCIYGELNTVARLYKTDKGQVSLRDELRAVCVKGKINVRLHLGE